MARPVSLFINTFGTSRVNMSDVQIAAKVNELFDMRPKKIEERLKLRNPIYLETAAYGHMGRKCETVVKEFGSYTKHPVKREVELFTWEKLDYVDAIKNAFMIGQND